MIAPDAFILCRNVVGSRAAPRLPGQVLYCSAYRKFVTVTKEGQSNFERRADARSCRRQSKGKVPSEFVELSGWLISEVYSQLAGNPAVIEMSN